MKNILKYALVLSLVSTFAFSQKAWVYGNIAGTNVLMSGKVSVLLADTATADTTNAANTIYSAVLSNSVNLLNGKVVQVGYVIIDTAKVTTSTGGLGGPIVSVDVQGSFNGTVWKTVVDSAVSAKRWNAETARTGAFNVGTATLTNIRYPYYRLALRTTGTLGAVSTWPAGGGQVPKLRFVIFTAN